MRVWCLVCAGLLFWGTTCVSAAEDFNLAGVGAVISKSPYRGVGVHSFVIPVLVGEYKNVYVKGVETGYTFYRNDTVAVSALVAPRFMGYHSSDSDDLAGMEDRERSLDAGIKAVWTLPYGENNFLATRIVTDVASRHDGQEVELALSKKIEGKIYRLTPELGLRFQSRRMVDYYYGVNAAEARAGRAVYAPGSTLNTYGNVLLSCGISPDWIVVTRVGVELLGSAVTKSPIVAEHYLVSGVVGLTRRF